MVTRSPPYATTSVTLILTVSTGVTGTSHWCGQSSIYLFQQIACGHSPVGLRTGGTQPPTVKNHGVNDEFHPWDIFENLGHFWDLRSQKMELWVKFWENDPRSGSNEPGKFGTREAGGTGRYIFGTIWHPQSRCYK